MSIDLAEKLKKKFTDKFVVVDGSVPELKRFAQWTGTVKTVNMNGRALVEFDGPVDIGWYDIDPAFLTVVDAPRPKEVKAAKAPPAAAAPAKPAAAPPAGGGSPLDKIRAQQAAKAGGASPPAATPAPAASPAGGAKLSPMEMIRAQQAAKAGGAATAPAAPAASAAPAEPAAPPSPAPAPVKPAAAPTTGPDGKPLSKLDQIRLQGAAKK